MNVGKFLWGIVILIIGFIFLMVNFGLANYSVFNELWKLWPIILVVIGLGVLGKSLIKPFEIVFNVISILLVLGAFAWIVFTIIQAENSQGTISKQDLRESTPATKEIREDLNPKAEKALVSIKTGAADFDIRGGSEQLISGNIETNFTNTTVKRSLSNKTDEVEIASSGFRFGWPKVNDWNFLLNKNLPLKLSIDSGASKGSLDLRNSNIDEIDIDAGASTFEVDLATNAKELKGNIDAGASTLDLKAPKNYGLKITLGGGLITNNFTSEGLTKEDKIYKSENYDLAQNKVNLVLDMGASTINLNRY